MVRQSEEAWSLSVLVLTVFVTAIVTVTVAHQGLIGPLINIGQTFSPMATTELNATSIF